ncbi:MAG TPA: neocarzinostatin apoprotein domain-containing protein, partial [Polyangiaceae bacterium]|nr:neocarzinostatin apoprotein domain-containing protein [Polyangiaceae bacterium]
MSRRFSSLTFPTLTTCWLLCSCADPEQPNDEATGSGTQSAIAPEAAVTVTPNDDLVDLQLVTINGTGFPANTSVIVGQCAADVTDILSGCTGDFTTRTTDASGSFSGTFAVRHTFTTFSGGRSVRCDGPGACIVGAALTEDPTQRRTAPVTFRYVPPPPPPPELSITVTPTSGLQDYQQVSVTGTNFPSNSFVGYRLCRGSSTGSPADCETMSGTGLTDISGNLNGTAQLRYTVTPPEGVPFTCDDAAGCKLMVLPSYNSTELVESEPLHFHTPAPVRVGSVQLSPQPVPVGPAVTATGEDWAAYSAVLLKLCTSATHAIPNQCLTPYIAQVGGDGHFSTTLVVRGEWDNGVSFVDCRAAAGACVLRVEDSRDPSVARTLPLTLAPLSVTPGTLTLDLNGPLVDRLAVRLLGSGWQPGRELRVLQCQGTGLEQCVRLTSTFSSQTGGSFRNYVELFGTFSGFTQAGAVEIDCMQEPGSCSIVVGYREALTATARRIPLTFVDSAQVQVTSHYHYCHKLDQQSRVKRSIE